MKSLLLTLNLLLSISCNQKPETGFSLTGNTNGIKDGTVLYLHDNLSDRTIDSTVVKKSSFKFRTEIPNFPIRILLRTEDFSQRRDIWLENDKMVFDASDTDFGNADVKGSESEDLSESLYKKAGKLSYEERNTLEKKFVEENPNSIVSAFILSIFSRDWGREFTSRTFEVFSKEIKVSEYGKKILDYLKLNKNIKVGDQFADFELTDQKGKSYRLSDLRGKTILLEFWASWCSPCRKENPNLVKTYDRYKHEGFEIFAVSLDKEKEKWIKAVENDGLTWINVSDLKFFDSKASLIYGVNELPDNFLIDKNGVIVERYIRGEKLNEKLKEIL